MKKVKNLDYLLSLGMFILQIAGYSLAGNLLITNDILRCSIILIIAIISFLLSILFKNLLEVDISSKVAYGLGAVGIVNTFIATGVHKVFGEWYSFVGDGVAIFLASIFILIGILAILTAVLYKNYNFIHLAFVSVIGMFISLLVHFKVDYYILMILIIGVLFILNLFKSKKVVFEFSTVGLIIAAGFSTFSSDESVILSSILFVMSIVSLMRVLSIKRVFEYQLLAIIVLITVLLDFTIFLPEIMSSNLALIVLVGIILIIDLFMSAFRIIDSKFIKIAYKVASIGILLFVVINCEFNPVAHIIAISFILVTSFVNTFAIHNDDYERYFLPFKILFLSYYFIKLMNNVSYIPIAFSVQAILFALVYRLFNKDNTKIAYSIVLGLSILLAAIYTKTSVITNIITIISALVTYLLFRGKSDDKVSNTLYYAMIFIFCMMISHLAFLEALVLILVLGYLSFMHRNNKAGFIITLLVLLLAVENFLSLSIKNYDVYVILNYSMVFILIGIATEMLFNESDKTKNIFSGVAYTLCFLALLGDVSGFITYIFALILSLVMILVSIRSNGYKALYSIGFIFSAIYLLELLGSFDDIPGAVYLLVIAIFLIVIASVMIYRYKKNENLKTSDEEVIETSVKKVEIKDNINYCPECGSKIGIKDTYCGECGKKVR